MKKHSGISSDRLMGFLGLHYAVIQAFYWAASASLLAFLVVFLQGRGFSTSDIGILNSVRIAAAIFGQFFYAMIADHFPRLPIKFLVFALLLLAAGCNLTLQLTTFGMLGCALLFLGFGLTECSVVSLIDSLALQYINIGVRIRYSACRAVGSAVYAVICFGMGPVLDYFGSESMLIIHGVFLILTVIAVGTFRTFKTSGVPAEREKKKEKKEKRNRQKRSGGLAGLFFHHPQYRWLLIGNAVLCFGYWPISGFLSNIMTEAGGSNTTLGIALFVGSMAEMPMMAFFYPMLARKFRSENLLFVSSLFHLIRWGSLIFLHNPVAIILVQALNMMSYGLSLPAAVTYINDHTEESVRVEGQTLFNMSGNIGGTFGNIIFSSVLGLYGTTVMTSSACLFIFLSCLIWLRMMMFSTGNKKKRKAA